MFDFIKSILTPDAIIKSVDALVLTEEERLEHQKDMLKLYEPFKVLQRYLALAIAAMFLLVLVISTGLFLAALWIPHLVGTAKQYADLGVVQMVGYAFISVVSLYFSGGVINTFKKGK